MILACKCPSPFQDSLYGIGMRVHNPSKPVRLRPTEARCTICTASKPAMALGSVGATKDSKTKKKK